MNRFLVHICRLALALRIGCAPASACPCLPPATCCGPSTVCADTLLSSAHHAAFPSASPAPIDAPALVPPIRGLDRSSRSLADSVMTEVLRHAPAYRQAVDEYRASLYLKGLVHIKKKNFGIRFLPSMFRVHRGVSDYVMETYSDLHFTAPDIYDHRVKAYMGTASEFWEADGRLLEFFRINVYSPTLLYDKLISPLSPEGRPYYSYRVDSVLLGGVGQSAYRIRFTPRNESYQLVEGYVVVTAGRWSVRQMVYSGRSEFLRYRSTITMGEVGTARESLPTAYQLEATFRFLGNEMGGQYLALIDYQDIHLAQDEATSLDVAPHDTSTVVPRPSTLHPQPLSPQQKPSTLQRKSPARKTKSRYDLSDSYTLTTDTMAHRRDTAYFNALRPTPLTPHEQQLYANFFAASTTSVASDTTRHDLADSLRHDTLAQPVPQARTARRRLEFFGQVGDALVSRHTLDLHRYGNLRFSPLINPFLLSYSGTNGVSYRLELKYNRLYAGDRLLRVVPQIGYNFREHEFYWQVKTDFDYMPRKRTAFHLAFGNGNRIYSSDVLEELKAIPDSLFDFDQIHLDYFHDLFVNLGHSWEIVNGLTLDLSLSVHRRTEVERTRFVLLETGTSSTSVASSTKPPISQVLAHMAPANPQPTSPVPLSEATPPATRTDDSYTSSYYPGFDPSILSRFHHSYHSFAPSIKLTWRPGQYYYMNGQRKVNLYSIYPTISASYERGLAGILPHSGSYDRWELDAQHHFSLGLMSQLYLRLGWGRFAHADNTYFVDFDNLKRSALPLGWADDIGGVFQLLDSRWYNSSSRYLRANAVYESPFILLRRLRFYTNHVLQERLYLGALVMPHLNPYVELGYGIGTHIFDFGCFLAFANGQYDQVGIKITFELFNR